MELKEILFATSTPMLLKIQGQVQLKWIISNYGTKSENFRHYTFRDLTVQAERGRFAARVLQGTGQGL